MNIYNEETAALSLENLATCPTGLNSVNGEGARNGGDPGKDEDCQFG